MAQYFEVHPDNPHVRLLKQAVGLLEKGGIVAVPTDSSYALVCHLDDKAAADARPLYLHPGGQQGSAPTREPPAAQDHWPACARP